MHAARALAPASPVRGPTWAPPAASAHPPLAPSASRRPPPHRAEVGCDEALRAALLRGAVRVGGAAGRLQLVVGVPSDSGGGRAGGTGQGRGGEREGSARAGRGDGAPGCAAWGDGAPSAGRHGARGQCLRGVAAPASCTRGSTEPCARPPSAAPRRPSRRGRHAPRPAVAKGVGQPHAVAAVLQGLRAPSRGVERCADAAARERVKALHVSSRGARACGRGGQECAGGVMS